MVMVASVVLGRGRRRPRRDGLANQSRGGGPLRREIAWPLPPAQGPWYLSPGVVQGPGSKQGRVCALCVP
jgi:hypothetical protein